MQIYIGNTLLASTGVFGPGGVTVSGGKLTDEVAFFRAAQAKFYDRGQRAVTVQFRVSWQFASAEAAELWLLTIWGQLPGEGDVVFFVGTNQVYMLGAQLETSIVRYTGASAVIEYVLRGPPPQTSNPPAIIPDPLAPPPVDPVTQRDRLTIASGAEERAVTFSSAFSAAPLVEPTLEVPAGSPMIDVQIVKDSVTATGFTARFDAPTPNANYRLVYEATL